jgi:hypothetical protein
MFKKLGQLIGGKKTYVAAIGAVSTAAIGYVNGDLAAAAALQLAVTGIVAATLRNAIGNLVPTV